MFLCHLVDDIPYFEVIIKHSNRTYISHYDIFCVVSPNKEIFTLF